MIHTIGKHRVKHGDIRESLRDLVPAPVDFLYCDPPWGKGNIKYWRTINERMTGYAAKDITTDILLSRIMEIFIEYTTDRALGWVEYGVRWRADVEEAVATSGLQILGRSGAVYGRPARPLDVYVLAKSYQILPPGYPETINNTSGAETSMEALRPFAQKGMAILDPCCGLGLTARAALAYGMTFYGNDFNAARLDRTRKVLGG